MATANASVFSLVGAKFLGRLYDDMDCQKFVENCLAEVGIKKDQAGSNAWYRYVTWTGTPEECKQKFGCIPQGAFLFILEHDGKEPEKYRKDGIGNASHIGIYTGLKGSEMVKLAKEAGVSNASSWDYGDGAIHSSKSREHVCTSKFAGKSIDGGWNRIGLWNTLSYGAYVDAILNENEDGGAEKMCQKATVVAETGETVNMRRRADKSGALARRVPVGEQVTVVERGNEWSEVTYMGDHGYMMTEFLQFDDEISAAPDELQQAYDIIGGCLKQLIVNKSELEHAYDLIGDVLGLRG